MRRPFFFLLLDSFLSLPLESFFVAAVESSADFVESAEAGADEFAAASGLGSAAAPVSDLGASLEGEAELGEVAEEVAGAAVDSAGGSFGASLAGDAVLLAPAGAASLVPTVSPDAGVLPGTTVATTPLPGVPREVLPPGVRSSPPAKVSDSGCKFGAPFLAATTISVSGPLFKMPKGFMNKLVCCRGVFCSAVIQARAVGSGCGMGTPKALSLSLAPGTRLERG